MRSKLLLIGSLICCALASWLLKGFNPYYYDILISVGIGIILATGLNLVNGYTGQFSLGHAGFMAVGAYLGSALSLEIQFGYPDWPNWAGDAFYWWPWDGFLTVVEAVLRIAVWLHNEFVTVTHSLPDTARFVIALFYGGAIASIAGLGIGVPSLRLKGDYLAIVTLGFNEIIKVVIQNAEPLGAQRGLGGMIRQTNLFWTFGFAAITIYAVLSLVNSTYGRGFLAVRDDEVAAEAMGINTTKYKVLAFVIAAFFAGIAGGLYAHFKQFITPEGFNFLRSVDIVVMVILGGMGNTVGVCFAAVLLTILPEVLRVFAKSEVLDRIIHFIYQGLSTEHFATASAKTRELFENRMILYSLLLIILMLTRPQGLFGGLGLPRRREQVEKK